MGGGGSTSSNFSKCSPFSKYVRLKKSLKPDYFTSHPKNKVLPRPYDLLSFTHEKKRHKKWMVINIYYKEQSPPSIVSDITDLFELYSFGFEGNVFLPLFQHYNAVEFYKLKFLLEVLLESLQPCQESEEWPDLWTLFSHNPEAISNSPLAPSTRSSAFSWEIPLDTSCKQTFYSMV